MADQNTVLAASDVLAEHRRHEQQSAIDSLTETGRKLMAQRDQLGAENDALRKGYSAQPYAWLGAAGLYRTRMDGVTNGEQQLTPLYLHPASPAAADVIAERRRQIEQEQWCPEHDDKHTRGELATAAASYATAAHWHAIGHRSGIPPARWPWDQSGWKPTTPRRDLVKAGALILAEIERLDRMESGKREAGHD